VRPADLLRWARSGAHRSRSIVDQDELPFRLFSGYSGWGDGQLEGELEVGGWLTAEATAELVFLSSEQQWQRLTREIGLDILGPEFKSKQLPDDPSLN
jgi:putative transcriptional regulator